MSRIRIHELAGELGVESRVVVERAVEMGMAVRSHMSALDEAEALRLRESFAGAGAAAAVPDARPPEEQEGEEGQPGSGRGDSGDRRGGQRGRGQPLSAEDPYWQFGTPVESWGSTRGDRRSDPSGLPPEDPYWQFGTPVESWGSSRKKEQRAGHDRQQRRRAYLECRTCGVKIEKKRAHGDRKVACPFCNRWMSEVR